MPTTIPGTPAFGIYHFSFYATLIGTFPETPVLDNFNRANGAIGSNWSGFTSAFSISSNQLLANTNGLDTHIYWGNTSYDPDQEAYVTVAQANTSAWELSLLLKSQNNLSYGNGVIEVYYQSNVDVLEVWTYDPTHDWVQYGDDIPVVFSNGDTLGARAKADGTIEVYKNGVLLASRDASSWTYAASGGYIGVWFANALNQTLDNFGGGSISGGEGFSNLSGQSGAVLESGSTVDPFNMTSNDASRFWQGLTLGASQDSRVTFTNVHTAVHKPHSNGVWNTDSIQVLYDLPNNRIQLWTYSAATPAGWIQRGTDIAVTFADGDVFSARALTNGTVEIYRNGTLLTAPSLAKQQNGLFQFASYHPLAELPKLPPQFNPLLQQQSTSLTIDYTYDALNRLAGATYSDGRSFDYTYDASGNVLQLEQDLGPGTVTTIYTYNTANELLTAQQSGTTWQYTYDANGSLTEVLPGGNPVNGAQHYTYNAAGYLVKAESHNGTSWNIQAEMNYNGLGQRLSMDAADVIAHYVMDGDRPLTAESAGNTTFYLYGFGAIGEKTTAWNYSLPDGTNTPRQLSDDGGDITLSGRYTPWGDTLETHGTGNFTFGYFSGVMDAATGLLYVGNGQYYDPATGRFLTRDVRPNSTNPYVPWDPTGAIIGPLGVLAFFFGRRKKGSKWAMLFVLLFVVGSVSMTLAGCGGGQPVVDPQNWTVLKGL